MSDRRDILVWVAQLIVGVAIFAQPARADTYSVIIRASCMPSIGFFTLETYIAANVMDGALEADNDILTTEKLERRPYSCELIDGVTITVRGICRSISNRGCAPGVGADVERLALLVNGEFIPFQDASLGPDNELNWLSIGQRRTHSKHSVEISGLRPYGSYPPELTVLHCRTDEGTQKDGNIFLQMNPLREDYTFRYPSGPPHAPWLTIDRQCRGFKKVLSGR